MWSRHNCGSPAGMTNTQASSGTLLALCPKSLKVTPARSLWPWTFNCFLPTSQFTTPPPPFLLYFPTKSCACTLSPFSLHGLPLARGTCHVQHQCSLGFHYIMIIISKSCLQRSVPQSKLHVKSQDRGCSPPLSRAGDYPRGQRNRSGWEAELWYSSAPWDAIYPFGVDEHMEFSKLHMQGKATYVCPPCKDPF